MKKNTVNMETGKSRRKKKGQISAKDRYLTLCGGLGYISELAESLQMAGELYIYSGEEMGEEDLCGMDVAVDCLLNELRDTCTEMLKC